MNKPNRILWFTLLLVILSSCSNKNNVIIKVEITSSSKNTIYLDKLGFSKSTTIDSAEVSSGEDRVTFKVKNIAEPSFFVVNIKGKGSITLLSEAGEKVIVKVDADKILGYNVEGSKGSNLTKELAIKFERTRKTLDSLNHQYSLTQNVVLKKKIEQEYVTAIDSQRAFSTRFVWANVMSRASVMALYQKYNENTYIFDKSDDLLLFKAVASSLRAFYPKSDYTKGMLSDIEQMQHVIDNYKLNNLISQSKISIPDIALPNAKGDVVKLSSLKGKVILLDFWASWNQSCLLNNRDLLEIYNQFKGKGFVVYQVSLDENREEWLNAIQSANLPWINVSELNPKGSITALTYNVKQLPANYLIDKDFSIIGKNLYGQELKNMLNEAL